MWYGLRVPTAITIVLESLDLKAREGGTR